MLNINYVYQLYLYMVIKNILLKNIDLDCQ